MRCSFFVCYDLRFADEFWALADRDRLLRRCPRTGPRRAASTGWRCCGPARSRTRRTSSASTASATAAGCTTRGDSMIIDPFGEVVAQAGDAETIITADVDPERVRTVRAEYPFLQDRR